MHNFYDSCGLVAMVVHLILRANNFFTQVKLMPFLELSFCFPLLLLICPLDIFYRRTRYCFIKIIRNIVCSPLYKVLMIPLLRHMESTACYFLAGSFRTHQYETCKSGRLFKELAYVISFLPYYWRAMQCARRWFDESDVNHLANMGNPTLYWDLSRIGGFHFNPNSKNLWLRDDLILKNKSIYYFSIALNAVLRVAWVETVMGFHNITYVESRLVDFLLASLEVIRRGHWNFTENEHLNNVGKFRAVKTVPLPFRGCRF
ncbi:hypothetical protein M0R45_018497 [Rubus argutus]|uniref:EXS domain-containing protein n=1 Tax=Rubus argutus TaxID=59490 RepID=A0AAW1X4C3_RUBAR